MTKQLTQEQHYQAFLARIPTEEAFVAEVQGKLKAIKDSGWPLGLKDADINMLCSLLPLNTVGEPQFWPPNG